MNSAHRYFLEPYKGMNTRFKCPACNHRNKTFSKYIEVESGNYVGDLVGRCERIDRCGYHYTPKQYFTDNGILPNPIQYSNPKPAYQKPIPSTIDKELFKKSLCGYNQNRLIMFLKTRFDSESVDNVLSKYFIGSSGYWPGSTVFWQIDKLGSIRTGKIMLYSASTGKRVKEPYNHISWAHKALKLENFNLSQCLFGEHLLKNGNKSVGVVESEKTAIIASLFIPDVNWLACGSLQNINHERCKVLSGFKTILYPDLNAYDKWNAKGIELGFNVSSLIENIATEPERKQGLDLADYLLREIKPSGQLLTKNLKTTLSNGNV